jgi:hypothetical protein
MTTILSFFLVLTFGGPLQSHNLTLQASSSDSDIVARGWDDGKTRHAQVYRVTVLRRECFESKFKCTVDALNGSLFRVRMEKLPIEAAQEIDP